MKGKGKYDDVATLVRKKTDAAMVVVMVFAGNDGHGFAVQAANPAMLAMLPAFLHDIADQIGEDIKRDMQ